MRLWNFHIHYYDFDKHKSCHEIFKSVSYDDERISNLFKNATNWDYEFEYFGIKTLVRHISSMSMLEVK